MVETASVEMVKRMALPVLSHGASLVLISIGALADEEFRARVESAARENGVKVHLASGPLPSWPRPRACRRPPRSTA